MIWDMLLARLGVCRMKHHLMLANEYSMMVDRYLYLRHYLKVLQKQTPHDTVKQEIEDVLRQAHNPGVQ